MTYGELLQHILYISKLEMTCGRHGWHMITKSNRNDIMVNIAGTKLSYGKQKWYMVNVGNK